MMLGISALLLGLLGLAGLYFHSTLPATGHIRPGFFVFYTNLSNLLLAVYQMALGVSSWAPQGGVFRWLSSPGVALSMTLCIFVTHLIYQWVLVPSARKRGKALSDIGFSSFGNLCVHYIVPWLTVVQWLLWQDKSGLTVGHAVWWLVLPLSYFAFGMVRGATGKAHRPHEALLPLPLHGPAGDGPALLAGDPAADRGVFRPGLPVRVHRTAAVNVKKERAWDVPCALPFCMHDWLSSRCGGPHTAPAVCRRRSSPDPRRTAPRSCPGYSPDSSARRCGA